ncbi:protein YIPF3 [Biomphalaria glabrata]|uniref:Protein YIPF3 n=1 Tax=Biomphalaria glabrata TaxID=6526 RepID=A0A2C9K0F6_BIOGL|nr:protein YIPF3-like [Biomphalaria glabrata]
MADVWHKQTKSTSAGSAVLDMDMEELNDRQSDLSDYEDQREPKERKNLADDLKERMKENVTQMVWQAGTQSAKRAWTLYGNIDILRPYFDVEPMEVQKRLLYSLIPIKPSDQRQQVPKELYGPSMVVLTLIAILLYQMKTAQHKVEEGTLIGSAIGVCFMYWFGASCIIWFLAYTCNVRIAMLQILSMMGYALFGHCIVLFLATVIHVGHDHLFFYSMWAIIGGLSTLKMATIIMSRSRGKTERLIVIGTIAALHLLFLLYLHFAYHTIVEEISDALNERLVPVPVQQEQVTEKIAQEIHESVFPKILPTLKNLDDIVPVTVKVLLNETKNDVDIVNRASQ